MINVRSAALFVRHPQISVDSVNGIIESLEGDFTFRLFSWDLVKENFFDNFDLVCFGGGIGHSDSFDRLLFRHRESIQQYVQDGGSYLGICMGAYWAGSHYFNILDQVDCVQYIKQPMTDTRRPHPKACKITWGGEQDRMFFYDGCAMTGNQEKFKTWARYANGDAMAIQQGRIGLIGCHPESLEYWYQRPRYMQNYWHGGRHHRLLREFVQNIVCP